MLNLDLWDPHRLASHVMATFSPEDKSDKRAEVVEFIMVNKIHGFISHYM